MNSHGERVHQSALPCPRSTTSSPFSFMFDFRARSLLSCLFLFISTVNALHFYLDADEKRCFIEELPTDTVVEGEAPPNTYDY